MQAWSAALQSQAEDGVVLKEIVNLLIVKHLLYRRHSYFVWVSYISRYEDVEVTPSS